MPFTGVYNGKVENLSYKQMLGETLTKDEQFVGFGSTPDSAKVRNTQDNSFYEVNLRDAMQNTGFQGVQYKPSVEDAKELGKLSYSKVDSGVVYNINRIHNVEDKKLFLRDKGFSDTFTDGEDWYGMKDGYMQSITNSTGLGKMDALGIWATKQAASAGAVIGSTAAVIASGVGATATGGAALPIAAVAGATGAVAGETVQRGIESAFGVEASKYNKNLSSSEEAVEMAKTAGEGAIGGVVGQVGGALLGKAVSGLAGAGKAMMPAGTAAEEWFGKAQAKAQLSYMEQQLPSGFAQRFGSAEEATAMDMIKSGSQKGLASEERIANIQNVQGKTVENSMQERLAPGAMKDSMRSASEALEAQNQLKARTIYKQDQALKAKEAEEAFKVNRFKEELSADKLDEHKGYFESVAREVFENQSKAVEDVLGQTKDFEKGYKQITNNVYKNLKSKGVKVDFDVTTGEAVGLEQDSVNKFVTKKFDLINKNAKDYTEKARQGFEYSQKPTNAVQGMTAETLDKIIGKASNPELKVELMKVKDAVKAHADDNAEAVKNVFDGFHEYVYGQMETMTSKDTARLVDAQNAMMNYEMHAANNLGAFSKYAHVQSSATEAMKLKNDGIFADNIAYHLNVLSDIENMAENGALHTKEVADVLHLQDMMLGKNKSEFRPHLSSTQVKEHDALAYVMMQKSNYKAPSEDASITRAAIIGAAGFAFDGGITGILAAAAGKTKTAGALVEKASSIAKKVPAAIQSGSEAVGSALKKYAPRVVAEEQAAKNKNSMFKEPEALQTKKSVVSSTDVINKKRYSEEQYTQKIFKKKKANE